MTFQFRPAVRERVSLLIGLAGASGSGKTYSALQLATGLAGPKGKIAVIDTEAGRALHYADRFRFDHGDMMPPFGPDRFREAIQAADKEGYDVIIIDSMSHEYEGDGGLIEWAAKLEADGVKSPGNWKLPKTAHKKMMSRLLQMRAHLIFCMRADEKIKIDKDPRTGKTAVLPLGWMPICEKRFMYELTCSFTLAPDTPGLPRFDLPHKCQEQHRPAFPDGRPIGQEAGEALAAWAHGGKPPRDRLFDEAQSAADTGAEAFRAFFAGLDKPSRDRLRPNMDAYKQAAEAADRRNTAPEPEADEDWTAADEPAIPLTDDGFPADEAAR